jgi:FlaA1/EpsC-like NDP-sugar epimerase
MTLPKRIYGPQTFPLILWDALSITLAFLIALSFRFDGEIPANYWASFVNILPLLILFYCAVNVPFGLYAHLWRYAAAQEVMTIFSACAVSTTILWVAMLAISKTRPLPLSVILLGGLLTPGFFTIIRYRQRLMTGVIARLERLAGSPNRQRVLIIGAGESGQFVARQFRSSARSHQYELVGFIDDDPAKRGLRVQGVPVLGNQQVIPEVVGQRKVGLIVIAIHNISGPDLRQILTRCLETSARVKLKPDFMNSIDHSDGTVPLQDITPADLLGRQPYKVDQAACRQLISGRVVLVTGAAGSIGSELCRQILNFNPRQLLLLDNNETGLHNLGISLDHRPSPPLVSEHEPGSEVSLLALSSQEQEAGGEVIPLIADITCPARMEAVFAAYRPQLVFHAAAYKHVPLMEIHPTEAVRVNVLGTHLITGLAARYGVERFVLISSDKAVRPSSIMGATKRLGELIVTAFDGGQEQSAASLNGRAKNGFEPTLPDRCQPTEAERRARGKEQRAIPPRAGLFWEQGSRRIEDGNRDQPITLRRPTLFTAVRFGNVLGSRGSVVPTFTRQIEQGGPVTITHPDMSRYFMSIAEAVSLVIQAATLTEGGDLFMLDMGQEIRIADLAHKLIRMRGLRPGQDIPIAYTGIRPGEKLREELLTPDEMQQPTIYSKIFRICSRPLPFNQAVLIKELSHLIGLAEEQRQEEMLGALWQLVLAGSEGSS